jgi:cell division protein FtsL
VRPSPAGGARAGERGGSSPALTVVRRRSRGLIKRGAPRRAAPVAIGVFILVATIVFGVVLEQIVLAQSAFRMARITESLAAAETRQQELLLEATRLESPTRIQRFARRRLGMVAPQEVDYLVADIGGQSAPAFARHGQRSRAEPAAAYAAPARR